MPISSAPLLLILFLSVLAPTSMVRLLSQFAQFKEQIAQIPTLRNWMSRMDSHITKETEQNFSSLTARMCKVETYPAPASNVSGSARSWPSGEQVDGSTARSLGSHGPGSSDDIRNTRRRLDTFSSIEDEQSRSAVLLRFPFEQYNRRITKRIDNLWEESNVPACNKPVRFIAKQVPCQSGLFLKHEPNVRTLLFNFRMMVSHMQLTVASAVPIQISLSANPNQLKTERSENNLRLCGENWLTILKFSSLMEMTKVHSSSQRSMLAHKSSASKIEETDLDNRFSNLLRLEADKLTLVAPDLCVHVIFPEVLQRVLSQANKPHV